MWMTVVIRCDTDTLTGPQQGGRRLWRPLGPGPVQRGVPQQGDQQRPLRDVSRSQGLDASSSTARWHVYS